MEWQIIALKNDGQISTYLQLELPSNGSYGHGMKFPVKIGLPASVIDISNIHSQFYYLHTYYNHIAGPAPVIVSI